MTGATRRGVRAWNSGLVSPMRTRRAALDMALKVHGLSAHSQDGYGEWGVSGSLRLEPGAAGRGLTASLTPSYGVDPGGSERLWALPDAEALAANGEAVPSSRLDAELGYGMGVFGGGFTATPHVGFGLSDTAREVRSVVWEHKGRHADVVAVFIGVARRAQRRSLPNDHDMIRDILPRQVASRPLHLGMT